MLKIFLQIKLALILLVDITSFTIYNLGRIFRNNFIFGLLLIYSSFKYKNILFVHPIHKLHRCF